MRTRHDVRTTRTTAAALVAACAVVAAGGTAQATATPQPGPPGFARSWTDSVVVPLFPAGGEARPDTVARSAISANGRFVAAAGEDTHGVAGVIVRDRRTGRQRFVDPLAFGLSEPAPVSWVGIDDSGTRLVVQTTAVEEYGATYDVSIALDLAYGTAENLGHVIPVALSADGRSLAYQIQDPSSMDHGGGVLSVGGGPAVSWSHDIRVDGDVGIVSLSADGRCALVIRRGKENAEAGNDRDGYLEDLVTHTHRVITTDGRGTPVGGGPAAVSGDCSTVAFWTAAELVPGAGGDGKEHLFVRRLATGRTSAVLVDGVPVALPAGGARVQLDTTGRQVSVALRRTPISSPRRLTVSAVPAGPTVDITAPGMINAVMSGDGRTALFFTGATYAGGPLFVRERVWP